MAPNDVLVEVAYCGGFAGATFINGKTQIARAVGASPIIIAGLTRDEKVRLRLAREFGADAVVNVEKDNLLETVKKMTGGIGADFRGN